MKDKQLINERLEDVNGLIAPYKLAYISPSEDCVLLEKNAHYMDKNIFDRLVANVSADGFLSQLPFCMLREDGKYLVLSGNHRVKAAVKAGLADILVLYIDQTDKDTQLAYQLSHNALVGKDDVQMLKEIFSEIESLEKKEFAGYNDLQFSDISKISLPCIGDGAITLTELRLQFVEFKKAAIEEVLTALDKATISENSRIIMCPFDVFIKVFTEIKRRYGIKNKSAAFAKMIDICTERLEAEKLAGQNAESNG